MSEQQQEQPVLDELGEEREGERLGKRLATVFPDTPGPAAHASTGVKRTNITGRSPGH